MADACTACAKGQVRQMRLERDELMSNLTAREAFEKAGYPVPEGCGLVVSISHYGEYAWLAVHVSGTTKHFRKLSDEWDWRVAYKERLIVDLSNLPAKDCLDALPEVVRKVVEASE